MYVAFRFGAKKKKQQQQKSKQKAKKKKLLEATNRVAGVNLLCSP